MEKDLKEHLLVLADDSEEHGEELLSKFLVDAANDDQFTGALRIISEYIDTYFTLLQEERSDELSNRRMSELLQEAKIPVTSVKGRLKVPKNYDATMHVLLIDILIPFANEGVFEEEFGERG